MRLPDADTCARGDARCEGRPEMLSCAGTGLAQCAFMWRRGGALIAVGTRGETRPTVTGIEFLRPDDR